MSGFHCGQERKLQKQAGYICADRFLPILKIRLQTSGGPYNSHSFDDCFLYKKGEANSLTHRINDLGWAKLKCRKWATGTCQKQWVWRPKILTAFFGVDGIASVGKVWRLHSIARFRIQIVHAHFRAARFLPITAIFYRGSFDFPFDLFAEFRRILTDH